MRKIKYSKDVDTLLIELSDKQIDYAEEEGQVIIHFSKDGEFVLLEILDAKDFILNLLSSVVKEKEFLSRSGLARKFLSSARILGRAEVSSLSL